MINECSVRQFGATTSMCLGELQDPARALAYLPVTPTQGVSPPLNMVRFSEFLQEALC